MSFDQLLLLVFVAPGLAFSLYSGVRTMRFVRRSHRTRATIARVVRDQHEDKDHLYIFNFIDSAGEQVISDLISWPSWFELGQRVDILYDPENPRTGIEVDNFFRIWAMTILPALSSLIMFTLFTLGFR